MSADVLATSERALREAPEPGRTTGPAGPLPPAPPSPRRSRAGRAPAILVVLTLLIGGVFGTTTVMLWRDVDRIEEGLGNVAALEARVEEAEEAAEALGGRVGVLEGDVDFDPAAVAEQVAPSVFSIIAPLGEESSSLGTGFVFGKDGRRSLLVTNFHVVEERWSVGARDVIVEQGQRRYVGEILRVSPSDDLALIEVVADLPALESATTPTQVGDPVLVVGSGAALEGTVTTGVVSAIDRIMDGQEWIQFSAQINPGNSGGPVVDAEGHVIGVATAKAVAVELEGLGFAIPVERACIALDLC